MKVKFKGFRCTAVGMSYLDNNRKCIRLFDDEDGAPVATATVNVPGSNVADNCVIVKTYSENEGMAEALQAAGIINSTPVTIASPGRVILPVFELTPKALELWKEKS